MPTKPFSFSTSAKSSLTSNKLLPKSNASRKSKGFGDSDSEDEQKKDRHILVTGFDKSGARTAEKQEKGKLLVIPRIANRDWMAESRKRKGIYVPGGQSSLSATNLDTTGDEPQKTGLHVVKKEELVEVIVENTVCSTTIQSESVKIKTEDEIAVEALTGVKAEYDELVLESAENRDWRVANTEDLAYRADVATRPDIPSLEAYEAIPVEAFGRAMLRGMGWKEGQGVGRNNNGRTRPKEVKQRPQFLGIGAKEAEHLDELGAWGKGASKREKMIYNPVIKVDRKTGRIIEKQHRSSSRASSEQELTERRRLVEDERRTCSDREHVLYRRRDDHQIRDYRHGRR